MTEAVAERVVAQESWQRQADRAGALSCECERTEGAPAKDRRKGKRNKALGARGEDAAACFLERRGYEILERNWVCFAGEADIIAKDDDTIVFVEVKTRKDCQKGFPSEAVTPSKRSKYEKIALAYLSDHVQAEHPVRFDVVSLVVIGPSKAMVRHQINAFSAA